MQRAENVFDSSTLTLSGHQQYDRILTKASVSVDSADNSISRAALSTLDENLLDYAVLWIQF